jgi:hypothetical protein
VLCVYYFVCEILSISQCAAFNIIGNELNNLYEFSNNFGYPFKLIMVQT